MKPVSLPLRHALLALAVVIVWGSNFVVIKWALADLPPLFFATLRFTCVALPMVFFLKRPKVPWSNLAAYGVLIGAGQFGLLYLAMNKDISPGLASLVVQAQVFFTIGLAMFFNKEPIKLYQCLALVIAVVGIVVIGLHADGTTTTKGILMILAAALCWAGGNFFSKRAGSVNMLGYVVWASLFSVPCLLVLSLTFEGWSAIEAGLQQSHATTWFAVVWQAVGNTMFGYGAWAWLLSRHPAATITPVALLVPVFGMAASGWWLSEPMPTWKLVAAALVMGGLALNLLWPIVRPKLQRKGVL